MVASREQALHFLEFEGVGMRVPRVLVVSGTVAAVAGTLIVAASSTITSAAAPARAVRPAATHRPSARFISEARAALVKYLNHNHGTAMLVHPATRPAIKGDDDNQSSFNWSGYADVATNRGTFTQRGRAVDDARGDVHQGGHDHLRVGRPRRHGAMEPSSRTERLTGATGIPPPTSRGTRCTPLAPSKWVTLSSPATTSRQRDSKWHRVHARAHRLHATPQTASPSRRPVLSRRAWTRARNGSQSGPNSRSASRRSPTITPGPSATERRRRMARRARSTASRGPANR